ncbi:MAG: hypothetical protein ACRKFN_10535 [Desulfitobacterium sp.]
MKNRRPITKERLQDYANLIREIDNQIERLELMEEKMTAPASPKLDGMPRSGSSTFDRMTLELAKKEELEKGIKRLIQKERDEAADIQEATKLLKKADERQVILLRYIDGLQWPEICEALYGQEKDYEERAEALMRKTFRVHGFALKNMEAATTPPEDQEAGEEINQ